MQGVGTRETERELSGETFKRLPLVSFCSSGLSPSMLPRGSSGGCATCASGGTPSLFWCERVEAREKKKRRAQTEAKRERSDCFFFFSQSTRKVRVVHFFFFVFLTPLRLFSSRRWLGICFRSEAGATGIATAAAEEAPPLSARAMADAAAASAAAAAAAARATAEASTTTTTTPRSDPRHSHRSRFHARVRADALARQRAARGAGLEAARKSRLEQEGRADTSEKGEAAPVREAETEGRPSSAAPTAVATATAAGAPPRPFWARQLMGHEWMVDVPEDLAENW